MLAWAGVASAQVAVDSGTTRPQTYEEKLAAESAKVGGTASVPPVVDNQKTPAAQAGTGFAYTATPELKAALGRALYEDHQEALDYNRRVFAWQMTSTRVSFWIVIGLVGVGVIFAAVQFAKSMRTAGTIADPNTEIEISAKGLKVTSPVLGVIILTISLGFFYLYLVHVYPIEYIRGAPPPTAGANASATETP
jgi:uncharacterized membrane protein